MEILNFSTMKIIFKIIALIQIFLFFLLVCLTLAFKLYQDRQQKERDKDLAKIKKLLLNYKHLKPQDIDYLHAHRQLAFAEFFNLEKQNALEDRAVTINILNELFLPQLQDDVYSKNWYCRNQAAMLLQLKHKYFKNIIEPVDEDFLIRLMDDSVTKVSLNACVAVLFAPTQKTMDFLIDLISLKRRSQYELLKTLLDQSSLDVASFIQKRLSNEKNPHIRAFCYRILRYLPKLELSIPFLHHDLESDEIDLQLACLSYIYHIDKADYKSEFIKATQSPHWEVRARCAKIIGYTKDEQLAKTLEPLLKDDVWWVRYRAAEALTQMGQTGNDILAAQDIKKDKFAYEIAQHQLERLRLNRGK